MGLNEKAIRLVEYLSALARINSKIVRNIDEYQKILWFYSIPHEPKHCFTRAWGAEDEHGDDIWIEIKKFPEPILPAPPETCRAWVKNETLRNTSNVPDIFEEVTQTTESVDETTGETYQSAKILHLKDHPEIKNIWDKYLEDKWLPWAEIYDRFKVVQSVYADLFHIYQEQQKLGEQYELVLSIGLLTWQTPTGHITRRHLITAKASLEFESNIGKFTVRPAPDGEQVEIELDMLDIEIQPQNARQLIDTGCEVLRDNVWDRASVDAILNSIANSLADSGQGEYFQERLEPRNNPPSVKPTIEYAPALILRKRSMRGLELMLSKMKEQIEGGDQSIPHAFVDLCESLNLHDQSEIEDEGNKQLLTDSEIYFPLRSNDEQRKIIRTLDYQKGVLVQGPPGTGKSHTIANLICHLLATGKRVLVTAKTPRALQVLGEKLPTDVQPLCINLLGSGVEEREALEKSVSGILMQIDHRNEINANQRIEVLQSQIKTNRKEKAATDKKLIGIREAETYKHDVVAGGVYSGTAADIARKIKHGEEKYSWFTDEIPCDADFPLSKEEVTRLCRDIVDIDCNAEKTLSLYIPDPVVDLPASDKLQELFSRERIAKEKMSSHSELLLVPEGRALSRVNREVVEKLVSSLLDIVTTLENVQKRPMEWLSDATYDVLTDKDTPWKELLKLSTGHCVGLREAAVRVDHFDVLIPSDIERKKLLHDAKALKSHFENGGKIGFWIFKAKAVRKHGACIGKVSIDGLDCSNTETLQKLIDYLTVEQTLEYVWSLWEGKTLRDEGPFPLQVAEIDELHEALSSVIDLYELREVANENIEKIKGLAKPSWHETSSIRKLLDICRAVLAHLDLQSVVKELNTVQIELSKHAVRNNVHPVFTAFLDAFNNRNIDLLCQHLEQVRELFEKSKMLRVKREMIHKLSNCTPQLANELTHCREPHLWAKRLMDMSEAWAHARAKSWLTLYLKSDLESLSRLSTRLEEDIRRDLAELASMKAWNFCFSRMREEHRRHLMAWQQAMKKLGKGTGKHAHTWRQNAQRHLNECRDAVPAWVMPLHRVYETVEAGPGIFDVVIVDEASQCGPEALPLLYLGKRILVVGDDKQISPQAVGVNREPVQRLMKDFLSDFVHADSFDVENSLFAHGQIRFSNRITLREHFRCMPEIIGFSNDLCYRTDPLIPLRQYPPDRLEPLIHVHIDSGYREGSEQKVINRPEAESLVDVVERCCGDPRYQGMTMGVIALQGDVQANHIQDLLLRRIGAEEFENRRLICGNPYSFQGDERDVIFLSMVAAPNERIGALTQAADQRRFNVAASRAQDQMWLFHSVTANDLSEKCLRRHLLDYFCNPRSQITQALGEEAVVLREKAFHANRMIEKPPQPFESWFEVDVALDIAGRGYRVVPQFKFADKRIDLVVQGKAAQLAVECDGEFWHGIDEYTADMERQRKLERCDWRFIRIRESFYTASPEKALEPLWVMLKLLGIFPVDHEDNAAISEGNDEQSTEELDDEGESIRENGTTDTDEDESEDSRIQRVLPLNLQGHGIPTSTQEALQAKPDVVGRSVIEILRYRPNFSSMKKSMPTYILKKWGIRTRSHPRQVFARKVNDVIAVMVRKGFIVAYKSTNERIKLGLKWKEYPGLKLSELDK